MITAHWKSPNPAYDHALVQVLTINGDTARILTYDLVTHTVPLAELEEDVT